MHAFASVTLLILGILKDTNMKEPSPCMPLLMAACYFRCKCERPAAWAHLTLNEGSAVGMGAQAAWTQSDSSLIESAVEGGDPEASQVLGRIYERVDLLQVRRWCWVVNLLLFYNRFAKRCNCSISLYASNQRPGHN